MEMIRKLWNDESGQGLVEYGLLVGFVAVIEYGLLVGFVAVVVIALAALHDAGAAGLFERLNAYIASRSLSL
jgi:Flp pilus assembly pilin Flp